MQLDCIATRISLEIVTHAHRQSPGQYCPWSDIPVGSLPIVSPEGHFWARADWPYRWISLHSPIFLCFTRFRTKPNNTIHLWGPYLNGICTRNLHNQFFPPSFPFFFVLRRYDLASPNATMVGFIGNSQGGWIKEHRPNWRRVKPQHKWGERHLHKQGGTNQESKLGGESRIPKLLWVILKLNYAEWSCSRLDLPQIKLSRFKSKIFTHRNPKNQIKPQVQSGCRSFYSR